MHPGYAFVVVAVYPFPNLVSGSIRFKDPTALRLGYQDTAAGLHLMGAPLA